MYFKVLPGCKLYDELAALRKKIQSANDDATALAFELGFEDFYKKSFVLAGGFYGLIPNDGTTKPKDYCWAFQDREGNAVMPDKRLKKNADIIAQIEALPVVHYNELNDLVAYNRSMSAKAAPNGGTSYSFSPAIHFDNDVVALHVPAPSKKYRPVDGMQEITETEYNAIVDPDE